MTTRLIKKLILVMSLYGLSFPQIIQKMWGIVNAHKANPTYVPGLDPATTAVETKLTSAQGLFDAQAALVIQMKANTKLLNEAETDLINIFVSHWATQTQTAPDMNEERAVELGYNIKGQTPVVPPSQENVPLISNIIISIHGEHTIFCINSLSGLVKLPDGILRIDIYGQTGGTRPIDLTQLIANGGGYLGQASRGKFVNTLSNDNIGKIEYYIIVYILKATKKPFTQSAVGSALIS